MTSKTPTNNVSIRQAAAEDADKLATLAAQLGYPSTAEQIQERLDQIVFDREQVVLVAELPGGELAGFTHVFTAQRLVSDPFAELGALVVDECMFGTGIGTELLKTAEDWALVHGLQEMRIRSNTLRSAAREFYLHIGYDLSKTQNVFLKRLK